MFGEPNQRIDSIQAHFFVCLFWASVLLFWLCFVPLGWFWLANFTTCSFKCKYRHWGGKGQGKDKFSGHEISKTILFHQFKQMQQSS